MSRSRAASLPAAAAALIAALASAPRRAHADGTGVRIAQLAYDGGNWHPRPGGLARLAWEIDKRTSIDVAIEPAVVRLTDADLAGHPWLVLAGDRPFPPPPEDGVVRLRRHLERGGFLLVDSAEARPGGGFDRSVRALASRLFPRAPLATLAGDHVIYKSFYLLDGAPGRVMAAPLAEAIVQDGEVVVLYVQNDLGGAWARDPLGTWRHEVVPGGERQREMAFRFGINVAMYALCLDYKQDQVHVPFILKRRRWRVPE